MIGINVTDFAVRCSGELGWQWRLYKKMSAEQKNVLISW